MLNQYLEVDKVSYSRTQHIDAAGREILSLALNQATVLGSTFKYQTVKAMKQFI